MVDRALEYAALAAGGMRAVEIARRRRRSKGYVSIMLRLGRALRSASAEEVAALRSDRITWKVAQQIVRADVADAVILHRLRLALGGFSSYTIDRRRQRRRRRAADAASSHPSPDTFVWQWDAAWAGRDPLAYAEAYRAFLTRLHRGVSARLRAHLTAPRTPPLPDGAPAAAAAEGSVGLRESASPAGRDGRPLRPLAGQSLRQLTASLGHRRGAPTVAPLPLEARQALAMLGELDAALLRLDRGGADEVDPDGEE